jgi:inorganic pyrophosphatase
MIVKFPTERSLDVLIEKLEERYEAIEKADQLMAQLLHQVEEIQEEYDSLLRGYVKAVGAENVEVRYALHSASLIVEIQEDGSLKIR